MARSIRNALITLAAGQSNIISEAKTSSRRVVLEINNLEALGGNDLFVAVDGEAAANKGRRVQPGQSIIWTTDSGYIPPQMRITGYSAGAINLAVYEEIEG